MITISDTLVVILIVGTIPAAITFPLLFALTTRWWETLVGRALLVKSLATLLLMGLAALIRVLDINDNVAAVLRLIIMSLIFLGVNGMCWALLREKWPVFRAWLKHHRQVAK